MKRRGYPLLNPRAAFIKSWAPNNPVYICKDCGVNINKMPWSLSEPEPAVQSKEFYMVHNSLWRRARGGKGFLCIACLERRLKRPLRKRDFSKAPINRHRFDETPRLYSRKFGGTLLSNQFVKEYGQ